MKHPRLPHLSKRLLKLKEAAHYLSISPAKLRAVIRAGQLPVVKLGDGNVPWLLDVKDLDAWIERHKERL